MLIYNADSDDEEEDDEDEYEDESEDEFESDSDCDCLAYVAGSEDVGGGAQGRGVGVELMERCWNRSDTTSLESQVREYIYENGRSRSKSPARWSFGADDEIKDVVITSARIRCRMTRCVAPPRFFLFFCAVLMTGGA